MPTTEAGASITPQHGYTKDGTPVYAKTRHFFKTDTVAQRINAAVGLRITVLVGTMWCAYLFAAIALISLPDNIHSTQLLILWISSSFLQLVLLPIIIVGQNIQSRAADARSTKTFEDVQDVRDKVDHVISLLDIHSEGGLHDAVHVIMEAVNGKAAASGAAGAPT